MLPWVREISPTKAASVFLLSLEEGPHFLSASKSPGAMTTVRSSSFLEGFLQPLSTGGGHGGSPYSASRQDLEELS